MPGAVQQSQNVELCCMYLNLVNKNIKTKWVVVKKLTLENTQVWCFSDNNADVHLPRIYL